MTRLIDADDLKARIPTIEDEYKYVHKLIDNAPTVEMPNWYKVYEDVKGTFEKYQSTQIAWEQGYEAGLAQGESDRPRGEWIKSSDNMYFCSKCFFTKEQQILNYCAFCGADMRKGTEE